MRCVWAGWSETSTVLRSTIRQLIAGLATLGLGVLQKGTMGAKSSLSDIKRDTACGNRRKSFIMYTCVACYVTEWPFFARLEASLAEVHREWLILRESRQHELIEWTYRALYMTFCTLMLPLSFKDNFQRIMVIEIGSY